MARGRAGIVPRSPFPSPARDRLSETASRRRLRPQVGPSPRGGESSRVGVRTGHERGIPRRSPSRAAPRHRSARPRRVPVWEERRFSICRPPRCDFGASSAAALPPGQGRAAGLQLLLGVRERDGGSCGWKGCGWRWEALEPFPGSAASAVLPRHVQPLRHELALLAQTRSALRRRQMPLRGEGRLKEH